MTSPQRYPPVLFFSAIAALTLACSLGRETSAGLVSQLEQVKGATVQIIAEGSFMDPQVGMMVNAAGAGSGFIIDPSGIAVTNNHVVTGAALLRVFVGGEEEPRNARVLGVSECSDLAVIDIDGEAFPYFEWYDEPISVGTEVYAAGYPLGEREFTLTKGIVSKERHSGQTPWSSVGQVLEHDATINPGSSGGPLVTADGKVVAVNYLKSAADAFVASQYFAIARDEALPVIERLRAGEEVNSIGINGEAVNDGAGFSGIWVSSVQSGSPADVAGVKSGDIILAMEGLVLATDYTLSSYCDILRSHAPADTLRLEVLRFSTREFLEGQLNGRPLAVSFSFGNELDGEVAGDPGALSEVYDSYVVVTDDSRSLQVELPSQWSDIDGGPFIFDGQPIGAGIVAAENLSKFWDSWEGSGMYFYVTDDIATMGGHVGFLDMQREFHLSNCVDRGRKDFENLTYAGQYDLYADCGGAGGPLVLLVAAEPREDPQAHLVMIGLQVTRDADLDALDHILRTFQVVGPLP